MNQKRFTVRDDGRVIDDFDFHYDATLRVDGDFPSDDERFNYSAGLAQTLNAALAEPAACSCETCTPQDIMRQRMILCSICGNKRCPHATNHQNACTGSNELGQPGSSYGPKAEPAAEDYNHVPLKPAFTVQATYEHTGKMSPRKFSDEPAAEPVAWACFKNGALQHELVGSELDVDFWVKSDEPEMQGMTKVSLYTASHPPRAPLTEEQIAECVVRTSDPVAFGRLQDKFLLLNEFARAIEAEHGIKESE
jgi:hypothetical protein